MQLQPTKQTRIFFLCLICACQLLNTQRALALDAATSGVVVIHGKGGGPDGIRPIGDALQAAGFIVERPNMPWAGNRGYDKPFDESIEEIAAAVARLKARGARNLIVAGHSLGGDAALRFATTDVELSAVVLVAPAHFPEGEKARVIATDSVARARQQVSNASVANNVGFLEVPSGNTLKIPAKTYLSYYDPKGPAAMSLFAPAVKVHHLAWLAPTNDPATPIFASLVAPKLPASVDVDKFDINSDHGGAPQAGAEKIVEYLKNLPGN